MVKLYYSYVPQSSTLQLAVQRSSTTLGGIINHAEYKAPLHARFSICPGRENGEHTKVNSCPKQLHMPSL